MTVFVEGLATATQAVNKRMRGPSASIAFDEKGEPTKAAQGFARGKGIDVGELKTETDADGNEYVYAYISEQSKDARELLPGLLGKVIADISWPRSQRWGAHSETFARPVRWMVCLLDDEVIDVTFAGVRAGNQTRGHRLLANRQAAIGDAKKQTYQSVMQELSVISSAPERARVIREAVKQIENDSHLVVDMPQQTFDEVVNLTEWPVVFAAHFDDVFLGVPSEIITDAMLEHQRYFPLYTAAGDLSSTFIVVSNGNPEHAQTIIDGNERVVRARLSDAKFFYDEDLKKPLDAYVSELENVTFQEKLGSLAEKNQRNTALAGWLAREAGLDERDVEHAERAAYLAKADLVTSAVVEFTSLQGIMGSYYAQAHGEDAAVVDAIREQYQPRTQDDELPQAAVSKTVALADKLDTVCGIFAAGEGPTGSSDPYAVRRQAISVIRLLRTLPEIHLIDAVDHALSPYREMLSIENEKVKQEIVTFFAARLAVMAHDAGVDQDVIAAVQAVGLLDPADFFNRIEALDNARDANPTLFEDLAIAYARAHNLSTKELSIDELDRIELVKDLLDSAEIELLAQIEHAEQAVDSALAKGDYKDALSALQVLRQPIDRFFDEVLVMDPDETLRNNRLYLLHRFVKVFRDVADIGMLAPTKH